MCDVRRAVGVVAPVHLHPERKTVKLSTVSGMDLLGEEFLQSCLSSRTAELVLLSCYIRRRKKKRGADEFQLREQRPRPPKSQGLRIPTGEATP